MAASSAMKTIRETNFAGIAPTARGKVRDIYDLGDRLLIVATDRLSAFDVVMPTPIPDKGRVLIVLDAVNQLDRSAEPARLAAWLPQRLPGRTKLVLSALAPAVGEAACIMRPSRVEKFRKAAALARFSALL